MKTSKSPKRVLVEAFEVAQASLPAYSHHFSPKKFTQHQLFACLVLKDFYNLTYRGVRDLLLDADSLSRAIGLNEIPHWTTFQKAANRLLVARWFQRLLTISMQTLGHLARKNLRDGWLADDFQLPLLYERLSWKRINIRGRDPYEYSRL